jgi:hypothetical protein
VVVEEEVVLRVVVVNLSSGKGNLVIYDLDGCNCGIPNVDHALNCLDKSANFTSTGHLNRIGTGRADLY